ncbi:MAG: protease SohB [Acidobacteriota bacterium]|nr:protease SohB [Acidobacteriota bacterium]
MEFFLDIAGFGIKIAILAAALVLLIGLIINMFRRDHDTGDIVITSLNDHYRRISRIMRSAVLTKAAFKESEHQLKKKAKDKDDKKIFVIDFHGDLAATMVADLREQVTAVLQVAGENDEVVVILESDGGIYENYGLGAAQLDRLKQHCIPLTVCIDRVAASGGYMMACMADRLLAAPFAIIGSIGVAVSIPNANRLLKKFDVEYVELTAGSYKRTLGYFGEITDKGKQKVQEELEDSHRLFKEHISEYRPQMDVDTLATGETWYGARALEHRLVDELMTSDEYLCDQAEKARIWRVTYHAPRSVRDRVVSTLSESADRLLIRWWRRLQKVRAERA